MPRDLGFHLFRVPDLTKSTIDQGEPMFGMVICDDRRWAEAWRCLGLQEVEVALLGFNSPGYTPHIWSTDSNLLRQANADAIFRPNFGHAGAFVHELLLLG